MNAAAEDLLQKMIAEKEAEEAVEVIVYTPEEVANYRSFYRSYTSQGKRPLIRFGGNFWGINRNRCTILRPAMIKALVEGGVLAHSGSQLKFVS